MNQCSRSSMRLIDYRSSLGNIKFDRDWYHRSAFPYSSLEECESAHAQERVYGERGYCITA